jgi:hypothetical protein
MTPILPLEDSSPFVKGLQRQVLLLQIKEYSCQKLARAELVVYDDVRIARSIVAMVVAGVQDV